MSASSGDGGAGLSAEGRSGSSGAGTKKHRRSSSKRKEEKGSASAAAAAAGASAPSAGKSKEKLVKATSSGRRKSSHKGSGSSGGGGTGGDAAGALRSSGGAPPRTLEDDYEVDTGNELGRGAFSIVVEGRNRRTGERVAVKVINKKDLGPDSQKNLSREIDILKKVKHPNVIALKDLYDTKERLYLVMELVQGGELFDKIVEKGAYTEQEAATLVRKMVSAIDYLHSVGIVHRDLKPENLLLRDRNDVTDVCIADFGLSKIVGKSTMMMTACGKFMWTPSYVAPEVLNATGYGEEVDLWSIGVITYILLCGFPPFYGKTVPEIFEQIMVADFDFPEEYWDVVSEEAKDFIERLLCVNPKQRMGVKETLEHEWLAEGKAPDKKLAAVGDKLGEHLQVRRQESKVTKRSL